MALVAIGAGATCAPLNPVYRASEFEWALADIRAAALVAPAGSASPAVDVARSRGIAVLELSAAPGTEAGTFALAGAARRPPARPGFAGPDDTAARAAHLRHRGATEARAADASERRRVGARHRGRARAHRPRPLPQRDAAVSHSRTEHGLVVAGGRRQRRVHARLRGSGVPRLARGVSADLVHGGPLDPPNGPGGGPAAPRACRAVDAAVHSLGLFRHAERSSSRTWSAPSACRSSKRTG